MTTGIFKSAYWWRSMKASGIMSADSAADALIWDGRSAISFGNALNFSRYRSRAKNLLQHQRPYHPAHKRRHRITQNIADDGHGRTDNATTSGLHRRIIVARSKNQVLEPERDIAAPVRPRPKRPRNVQARLRRKCRAARGRAGSILPGRPGGPHDTARPFTVPGSGTIKNDHPVIPGKERSIRPLDSKSWIMLPLPWRRTKGSPAPPLDIMQPDAVNLQKTTGRRLSRSALFARYRLTKGHRSQSPNHRRRSSDQRSRICGGSASYSATKALHRDCGHR